MTVVTQTNGAFQAVNLGAPSWRNDLFKLVITICVNSEELDVSDFSKMTMQVDTVVLDRII